MTRGLQALLKGVVDYAGMFPPARLPLEQAVRNYAQYHYAQNQRAENSSMLGNFVIGAAQLDDLAELLGEFDPATDKFGVAVTCAASSDAADWSTDFDRQLADVASFLDRTKGKAALRALEVKLPRTDEAAPEQVLNTAFEKIAKAPWPQAQAFFEVTDGPAAMEARGLIADRAGQQRPDDPSFGLKLRTGGLEASAFPSIELVTEVIMLCEQHNCAWKATAGLHHPLRQFREEVNTKMHGFLNVLTAAVLANVRQLNHVQVSEIVGEEDLANFQFDDDSIGWREHRASVDQIEDARQRTMISFGSCDFEESLADLDLLHLQ